MIYLDIFVLIYKTQNKILLNKCIYLFVVNLKQHLNKYKFHISCNKNDRMNYQICLFI